MRRPLSAPEDLYRTLQVAPNADLEAIHAAYRRLARLYHPDLNPSPTAAERMRAINAAYRVLSDSGQRAAYDARHFLRSAPTAVVARPRPGVTAEKPPATPQQPVGRLVLVIGVGLLIVLGTYLVLIVSAASNSSSHPSGVNVPDRLRLDGGLRSFPGTVLVAPSNLAPFKDLPILRLDATGRGIARYAVYYGDLTTGVASISGLIGRESFDSAAPRLPDCPPEAVYCAGPGAGQSTPEPPGVELFRPPDLVNDYPAFAIHRVCCNGMSWSLSWYEPGTNMSYTIDLSRNVAAQFGGPAADRDISAARAVAALARQLVRLP